MTLLCRIGLHRWKVADWIYVQGRRAIAVYICRRCHAVRRVWMPRGENGRRGNSVQR
jgi:hypothetical protein